MFWLADFFVVLHVRRPVISQGLLFVQVLKLETGEKVKIVFFDVFHDFLDDFLPIFTEYMSLILVHPTKIITFIPLLVTYPTNTLAPFCYNSFIHNDNSIITSFIRVIW